MCGGPSLPKATDPKEERLKAEAEATTAANAKAAMAKRQRADQSLLASGAPSGTPVTSSVLATGKTTFGS